MELDLILKNRRTCRKFLDKKIDRNIIDILLDSALKAPVSCNLQISKYIVVDDQKLLKLLADKVSNKFIYSPCSIIFLTDNRYTIKRSSGLFSTAMAAENMILKATDLGLGNCPMAGFTKDKIIKEILKIPKNFDINLILAIGYPDDKVINLPINKIEKNQVFSFNIFDNSPSLPSAKNLSTCSISDVIDYRKRISSVYLDRFRLNTYSEYYYKLAASYFFDHLFSKKKGNILDVLTYDAQFLNTFFNNFNIDHRTVYAADYLESNLTFFDQILSCNTILIDKKNNIIFNQEDFFDYITFVYQFDFTPNVDLLIDNFGKLLKRDGKIFVVFVREHFWRRLAKSFVNLYKKVFKKEIFNIYENNPFYKVGYKKFYSQNKIKKIFLEKNFILEHSTNLFKNKKRGEDVLCMIFKKN